jgi:hypothetical protein
LKYVPDGFGRHLGILSMIQVRPGGITCRQYHNIHDRECIMSIDRPDHELCMNDITHVHIPLDGANYAPGMTVAELLRNNQTIMHDKISVRHVR